MTLDEHMQLTDDEIEHINESFSNFIKDKDYTGMLRFHRKVNSLAKNYIETHFEHSWHMMVAKDYNKF